VILGSECVIHGSECVILRSDGEKAWIERATFVVACEQGAIGRVEPAIA